MKKNLFRTALAALSAVAAVRRFRRRPFDQRRPAPRFRPRFTGLDLQLRRIDRQQDRDQLSEQRFRRRHQSGQGQDRRFRRHRQSADQRRARQSRPLPVPDADRRRGGRGQSARREAERAPARPQNARRHLPRQNHGVERSGDPGAESGAQAAEGPDHRCPPLRQFGYELHLHELPDQDFEGVGGAGRLRPAVNWPVGIGGQKNPGVCNNVARINGAIGYTEYTYAVEAKLSMVTLENRAGKFVAPTRSRSRLPASMPTGRTLPASIWS